MRGGRIGQMLFKCMNQLIFSEYIILYILGSMETLLTKFWHKYLANHPNNRSQSTNEETIVWRI